MTPRRRVLAAAAALVSVGALAVALSALRSGDLSNDNYAAFADCPLSDTQTDLCLVTQSEGGELVIGEKTLLALSRPIVLQAGVHVVENGDGEVLRDDLIAAAGSETVSRAPQAVPGGLHAIVDPGLLPAALRKRFDEVLAAGEDAVTATVELAGPASAIDFDMQNMIEGKGIALVLPVKVRLSNELLGASCYVGSNRNPMLLALTTGATDPPVPTRPMRGKTGHASFKDDYNLTVIEGSSLVNNSFTAPRARNCGGARGPYLDRAVNGALHLPAAAGHNTVILSGMLRDANAPAVRASR
jgi:hypothetical protein